MSVQKARCALATTMPSFTETFRFPVAAQPDGDDDGLRLLVELLDESTESEPAALIGMLEISLFDTFGSSSNAGQTVAVTKELCDPIGAVDEVYVRARLLEMAEHAAESSPRRAHAASLFGSVTLQLRFVPGGRASPISGPVVSISPKAESGGSTRKVARIFSRKDSKSPANAESPVNVSSTTVDYEDELQLPSDTKAVPEAEPARAVISDVDREAEPAPEITAAAATAGGMFSPRVADAPTSLPSTPPRGVEAQPAPGVVNLFAELFARVDRDDTGTITRAELIEAIYVDDAVRNTMGLPQRLNDVQRQTLDAVFREMDSDTSGAIDLTEFCVFMHNQFPDGNMAARFAPAPAPAPAPVAAPPPVPTVGVGVDSPPPPVPQVGAGVGSPSLRAEPRVQAVAMHSLRAATPSSPPAATRALPQQEQPAQVPKLAFEIEDLATDYGSREHVSSSSDDDIDHGDRDLLSDSDDDDPTPVTRTPVETTPERLVTKASKGSPARAKQARPGAASKPADSAATLASKQAVPKQAASAEERRLKLRRQEEKAAAKQLAEQEALQIEREAADERAREVREKWLENKALQRKVEQAALEKRKRQEAEVEWRRQDEVARVAKEAQAARARELEAMAEILPAHVAGERLECVARAVLRNGFELDSAHVGFVAAREVIDVLESAVNHRGQTRLRCADGWTSAAASTGGILFRPAPRPLETVHEEDEEDEGARVAAHIDLLYDRPAAPAGSSTGASYEMAEPVDEVEAAMALAHSIEEWLGGIETPRRGNNRFDSVGPRAMLPQTSTIRRLNDPV